MAKKETKPKKIGPFDVWKSIQNLEYLEDISPVNRYMLDQIISAYPDFVHAVNNINKIGTHHLSKRAIYDYYFYFNWWMQGLCSLS